MGQFFGYCVEVKRASGINLISFLVDHSGKQAIIYFGDKNRIPHEIGNIVKEVPSTLPLRLISANSFELPESFRNLNLPLKYGPEILEYFK